MIESNGYPGIGPGNAGFYPYSTYISPKGQMEAVNKQVATEPFPKIEGPVQEVSKGFAKDVRRNKLVPLRVVYGNNDFPTGCLVLVNSNQQIQPWAKERFTLEETGGEFIFVPESAILLRDSRHLWWGSVYTIDPNLAGATTTAPPVSFKIINDPLSNRCSSWVKMGANPETQCGLDKGHNGDHQYGPNLEQFGPKIGYGG
jgi:hypothetical protein